MICDRIQKRLLSLEEPAKPPASIRQHLNQCPNCLEWQRRLVDIEQNMPLLPVPESRGRLKMMLELLNPPLPKYRPEAAPEPVRSLDRPMAPAISIPKTNPIFAEPPAPKAVVRDSRRWKPWYTGASVAAASILLMLLGVWLTRGPEDDTHQTQKAGAHPDPLLASLVEYDLRLAEAQSPKQRVEALADLAEGLQIEMRALIPGAEAEDVQELARLYSRVIQDGMLTAARLLPAAQRSKVLEPIADRLARTKREADSKAEGVPPAASAPLRLVAAAAKAGDDNLRAFLKE